MFDSGNHDRCKLRQPRLSDAIVEKLQGMILEGCWLPGEKLPAERELATRFEVSRPSLREAIRILEVKGLVSRKQGGGTFVREAVWQQISDPLFALINSYDEAELDILEFRYALEGICAFYAASRRTATDIDQLRSVLDSIDAAEPSDAAQEADAVIRFILKVAEAAHNVVFLQVMHCLLPLLRQSVQNNFEQLQQQSGIKQKITQKRRELLLAIEHQQAEQARQISHEHLAMIEDALFKQRQQNSRVDRSMRRLQGVAENNNQE